MEVIQNGTIHTLKSQINDVFRAGRILDRYWLIYDTVEKVFHPYHSPEAKSVKRTGYNNFACFELGLISKDEWEKFDDVDFNRYVKINVDEKLINMLSDLLKRGWIKLEEDNRKA